MNNRLLLFLLGLTAGCGQPGKYYRDPPPQTPVEAGSGCSVSPTGLISCTNGTSYQVPAPEKGDQGVAGSPGTACTTEEIPAGVLVHCGENTTLIQHGADGTNGADGVDGVDGTDAPPTQFTVTEMIDPCGDGPGFDEVLLRLADDSLLAHFSNGPLQFLTVIGPGTYQTTDTQACTFTVSPIGAVTW